jgi:hypothetical protein
MAILDFPNTGLVANVTQYTGDNGTTYTWDGVKWIGRAAGVISGTTNKLVNVANEVVLEADGSITLPTLTTLDWDRRNLVGPTLQMGNDPTVTDAVITGPAPDLTNPNAVRLIIQGQEGFGSNNAGGFEGGDVYIWAGHGGEGNSYSGDGGDVKLRGGVGGLNGGYIRLEAGDAYAPQGNGGFLDLNAGNGNGLNGNGGDVNIRAGDGVGTGTSGRVNVYTDGGQWTFMPDGALILPSGATQTSTGSINCQPEVDTVVFTSSQAGIQTIKLLLQVEGTVTTGDADTQSCEMIVAKGFRGPTVAATVYAVVHTSVAPLATFTAEWNAVSSRVEVMCQPTSLTNSIAVKAFATEITTSD